MVTVMYSLYVLLCAYALWPYEVQEAWTCNVVIGDFVINIGRSAFFGRLDV